MNKLEKPYHYDGGNYYENPKDYKKVIKRFLKNEYKKNKV